MNLGKVRERQGGETDVGVITTVVGLALVIVLFYGAYRSIMGQVVREEVAAYGDTQECSVLILSHDLSSVEEFIRRHEKPVPLKLAAADMIAGVALAGSKSGADTVGMGDVKMQCLDALRKHADMLRRIIGDE